MNMSKALSYGRLYNQFTRLPKRYYTNTPPSTSSAPKPKVSSEVNVPGLSEKVLKVPPSAVGPGATKSSEYKNPEYFCYDKTSYFEAEIEMLKFRLPQPSSLKN